MTLTQYLKSETEQTHIKTEEAFGHFKLFQADFSEANYRELLIVQYQWHALLEDTYLHHAPFDHNVIKKSNLIRADLAYLGVVDIALPEIELPQLDPLGVAYVIEGSTMGSAMIYKFLSQQDLPAEALSFYHHCASSGVKSWPGLKKQIDSAEKSEEERAFVLSSAHYSFELALTLANSRN